MPPPAPPTAAAESIATAVRVEPVAALGKGEPNAAMSEAGLILGVEESLVAPTHEETKLVKADIALGGEVVIPEVRDPPKIQGAPELPEVGHDTLHDCRSGGSTPEGDGSSGAAFTGGSPWWGMDGSQGDPVLTLRQRIEV